MNEIFCVIVNYNSGETISDCLASLVKEKVKIIVVDNNSSDGSIEEVKRNYGKRVIYIENHTNLGFAKAANQGIMKALNEGAGVILLLNPDTLSAKNFLQSLIKSKADIAAPIIKFKLRGKWLYDHGGKINWVLGRTTHVETESGSPIKEKIDYVSGCAMMVKRKVFEKIGFFDERFFLYFEDLDFCLRARRAGFSIGVQPNAQIIHFLRQQKGHKTSLYLLKSNFIFINKYLPLYRRPIAYGYLILLGTKILFKR